MRALPRQEAPFNAMRSYMSGVGINQKRQSQLQALYAHGLCSLPHGPMVYESTYAPIVDRLDW